MFSSSFPQNKAANGCADIHLIKKTGWKSQIGPLGELLAYY